MRIGVICEDLGVLTTARAREFWVILLEPVKLIVWKVVIERVTVIKFRMDSGGCSGAGCFEVEIWADTAKFTNVIAAGFRKCRDFVGEGKMFIKNKAKVAIRVGCSERRVVYFRKLLFKSDKKKLSFRRVESQKVCSHPGRDLL